MSDLTAGTTGKEKMKERGGEGRRAEGGVGGRRGREGAGGRRGEGGEREREIKEREVGQGPCSASRGGGSQPPPLRL